MITRWADDGCQDHVMTRIPEHQVEQAEITQVQHLLTQTDNEGEGDFDFLEDLQQDNLTHKDARIQGKAGKDSDDELADQEDADENNFFDNKDDEHGDDCRPVSW
jgi:hypothetical protein